MLCGMSDLVALLKVGKSDHNPLQTVLPWKKKYTIERGHLRLSTGHARFQPSKHMVSDEK